MTSGISRKSKITHKEIGLTLSAGLHKFTDEAIFGLFGQDWQVCQLSRKAGILANVRHLQSIRVGQSTNGWKSVRWLNDTKTHADRIFVFTDCQLYDDSSWTWREDRERTIRDELNKYKQNINPNVRLYCINLNGYGTVNFPESDRLVVNINGWSDKIFKFVEFTEKDPKAQVKYIKEHY